MAFTLPNLFRRLLGEGALTSAMLPVLSKNLQAKGRKSAYDILNQVLSRLACILGLLVIVGCTGFYLISQVDQLGERWQLCADLSVWMFPYVGFICLSALAVAALHALGRFGAGAASPILLNMSWIVAISYGILRELPSYQLLMCMVLGVLFGGALQLTVPVLDLFRQGWRLNLRFDQSREYQKIRELVVPGLWGAGLFQLNILLSRLLAYTLEEHAVSILFIATRLVELPLGVGILSITTVFSFACPFSE